MKKMQHNRGLTDVLVSQTGARLENYSMNVYEVNLDISLPDNLRIDLWLVQWHTPTPVGFQPIGEPHRSEKARIIEQLTELLRQPAQTSPANHLAMVVFPEISLPKDQLRAIEELLAARDRPTIVVAGFEHLTWVDYEALATEMPDTPQLETCDAAHQAGTYVNVAGIWIRDRSGNVSRYLQPKLNPSDAEQPDLLAGQNVLVFKSDDQRSGHRLNFCVQICSDFCSRAFVEELRKDIDDRMPAMQLDMLVLPQHNPNRRAAQFMEAFDTYFDRGVEGSQTEGGCIIRVNNSALDHGKSEEYGDSGLCFPHGQWRVKNAPATYWMQTRGSHQAVTVRKGGPGAYRFSYKPHRLISRRPGSGQVTPFPDNSGLFAPIDKDDQGNAVILQPFSILAEAHWPVNEWRADRKLYQGNLESNMPLKPNDSRKEICTKCDIAHRASVFQWKGHVAVHSDRARWMLNSYLSCWSSESDYPPNQPEPNEWPDGVTRAVGQFLRCYSLVSLGTNWAIQPYHDRIVHARWGDGVGLFFLWGGGRKSVQAMIAECKSRISQVALIAGRILLVFIDPQGMPAIESLRDNLRLDEHVVEGCDDANLPEHLSPNGVVTRPQRHRSLNLIGSNQLWDKVYSATDEDDLVRGLGMILSEELATSA